MAKHETRPDGAVLVAVDIAKIRNEVLIEHPDAGRRRRLAITLLTRNTPGSFGSVERMWPSGTSVRGRLRMAAPDQ